MSLAAPIPAVEIGERREVEEWIGATPDTPVPDRVKLRVFARYEGRCYLSKVKIRPGMAWDVEHLIPIANGGQNRERNLAPALKDPHKVKSADDAKDKAHVDRMRRNHLGLKPKSRRPIPKRKDPWGKGRP